MGPRDGLQSEKKIIPTNEKIKLIRSLVRSGIRDIEVGSFVRSSWVPQLSDTSEVIKRLVKYKGLANLWVFVPNMIGLQKAIDSGASGVSFFYSVSNTFCKKNINSSKEVVKDNLKEMMAVAKKNKLLTRIYLSTSFYCPYEGEIKLTDTKKEINFLLSLKPSKVVVSDTTGSANPLLVAKLLKTFYSKKLTKYLALHFHDTQGMALANVIKSLDFGITEFDSSIAGLGGCPYAPNATGNLATEDLANMFLSMNGLKNISMPELLKAGHFCESIFKRKLPAKMLRV